MPLVALVCASLLGLADDVNPPASDNVAVAAEYRQAKAASGRTPEDQVRLALWCEAHGLTAERMRHLALALLADPANATARGLSGLVARDGRWVAPDSVAQAVRTDPVTAALLDEYDTRRSKTPYNADAQWGLGQWADDRGLKDQAKAHYTAVTRLDPAREIAWKRLGYKKHDGHWATDAQINAAKAETEAQKAADRTWKPLLEKWKAMLDKPSRKEDARTALLGVTDPRAVTSIARVFGTDRPSDQQLAVGLLGQIESPQASKGLAALAVFPSSADVRRTAVETLRQRDPRDFLGFWISLIRSPIKYEVRPVGGPGSPGSLFIAGTKANTQRIYRPMDAPNPANYPGMILTYDPDGQPLLVQDRGIHRESGIIFPKAQVEAMVRKEASDWDQTIQKLPDHRLSQALHKSLSGSTISFNALDRWNNAFNDGRMIVPGELNPVVQSQIQVPIGQMIREAQTSAQVAQNQINNDVGKLDAYNATIHQNNEPVLLALHDATGQNFGEDGARWNQWWVDQQGYAITDSSTSQTPTFVENVPIGFTPTAAPTLVSQTVGFVPVRHSCFGAGTPVRTIDGTKLIEKVQRGDLVLVQDTISGALSYQPVLTAFHNPPSATYRVKLGSDEVVATGIHRFWRAGKGWAMTRDLKPGDLVRTLGGVATVEAVSPEVVQPVFNLEVAEGRSFFVGRLGVLVHDNSLVEATPSPFDAARPREAAASATTAAVAPR